MRQTGHLDTDLLVRAIDDELNSSEHLNVEAHIADCEECQARFEELRVLSVRIDSCFGSAPITSKPEDRESLRNELERREIQLPDRQRTLPVISRRAGWWIAVAASVAMTVMLWPRFRQDSAAFEASQPSPPATGTLEVEGETFISLPYSNGDLPVNTPRIVRMEVPVASLLEAGVIFEPVSSDPGALDRSVLADVLIGMDGEPLGVHVVGSE